MPYKDHWLVDKRVGMQQLSGVVTLEDAEASRNGYLRFLEEGEPLVHLLVDVASIEKFPTNLVALKHLAPNVDNPNLGWLLICGAGNPLLRFVASTIAQVALRGLRLRMFNTTEEALTFLQGQDSTLGNLVSFGDTG